MSLGQMRTLLDRERLTDARIASLPDEERSGLETLRRAQAYGESLGLAPSTSYGHVIDRDNTSAVRVVTAAPAHRLESVSWWFPVVGRVTYRGFFNAARARNFAESLSNEGYDTYVRPALLYSTLGWFDDPIPQAVLRWPAVDLVDVVLHEQVHETIFPPDRVAYNESLATFIARQATPGFFESASLRQQAVDSYADQDTFSALMGAMYSELEQLYTQVAGPAEAREQRGAIFERYQGPLFAEREWKTRRYAGFPKAELSNSYILARRTYETDMDCFEAELQALGDLPAFIAAHRESPGHRACPETAR